MSRARPGGLWPLLALALGCGSPGGERQYAHNDLQIVGSYTAKDACSCLFVMEMGEDYCRAWVKASPAVARFTVDWRRKAVTSGALLLWGETARYVDDAVGCSFEP